MDVDVHQHLWPAPFVEALRERTRTPRLTGWTLHLDGEPDYEVNPQDHDIAVRQALLAADGFGLGVVSLSSPLGIEWLPVDEVPARGPRHHPVGRNVRRHPARCISQPAAWRHAAARPMRADRRARHRQRWRPLLAGRGRRPRAGARAAFSAGGW